MTIKQLKQIIQNLSDETPIIISAEDIYTAETITIEYHSDDRQYLILSNEE